MKGSLAPVSFAQQGLWIHQQSNPGDIAYNLTTILRLKGRLDVDAFRRAFAEIIRRHEVLRTTFVSEDGVPKQQIHDSDGFPAVIGDVRQVREGEELRRVIDGVMKTPFDLAHGPLIRAVLLRTAAEEHVFVLSVHHILVDGWSIRIIARELETLYPAFLRREHSPLPELPLQYQDHADSQREHLGNGKAEKLIEYWTRQLAGAAPEGLALPTDSSPMAAENRHVSCWTFQIPPELGGELRELSRRQGTTPFMTLLSVFQVLMFRYAGSTDVVVGTVASGRNRSEVEHLVGLFANLIVLRGDLSGNPEFRELLGRTRQMALDAYKNQDLPFPTLVEKLQPPRHDPSRTPFVSVVFGFESFPHGSWKLPPLDVIREEVPPTSARFDLEVQILEVDREFSGKVEYRTGLFEPGTIQRMTAHYVNLLSAVVKEPACRIGSLPLLDEQERRQIVEDWNATETACLPGECIHRLFESQVQRTPGTTALLFEDQKISYEALNARANQLARYLRRLGAGAESIVGVSMERSVQMMVSLLAVLKAGAAYVPMDPAYPADRLRLMLEDSRVMVLLTQSDLRERFSFYAGQTVSVDALAEGIDGEAADNLAGGAEPSSAAYVLYTSGSTGTPKAVVVEHRNVANFFTGIEPWVEDSRSSRTWLAVTSISFDISVLELFWTLSRGYKVVLHRTDESVPDLILRHGVSHLQCTPSLAGVLADAPQGMRALGHLRKLMIGGETFPPALAERFKRELTADLLNLYGPTETTIWSAVERVGEVRHTVPIGRPIANTQLYVLDEMQQPVPVGIAGELYIGGDGVARGYLNRPELTSERFLVNPFSRDSGARMYRTGDRVRYRPDGRLEFLGRLDRQIKLRGHRIELGEIEAALGRQPGVREAVATVSVDKAAEPRIIAHVVPVSGDLSYEQFRQGLRASLPEHMIPSAFIFLGALPRTPNGKVDRNALPGPDADKAEVRNQFAAPRNALEAGLASMWEETLGAGPVGIHDDFFAIGGHSLLAVKLFARIETAFGVRLPLATLFQAPTVEGLALVLKERIPGSASADSAAGRSLVSIRARGDGPALFLVHGAGGNVLLYRELAEQLAPEISVYGFQSQGLDGSSPALTTIRRMADRYVSELLEFRPSGPYYLGGYCMGGIVAYEMARALRSLGKEVRVLALLDSYNLSVLRKSPRIFPKWHRTRQRAAFHFKNVFRLNPKDLSSYAREKLRMSLEAVRQRAASSEAWMTIQSINDRAGWDHEPGPYEGNAVVFKPAKNYDYFPDPRMGWGDCVHGALEVVSLTANPHAMLIGPFANQLAREIRLRIIGQ